MQCIGQTALERRSKREETGIRESREREGHEGEGNFRGRAAATMEGERGGEAGRQWGSPHVLKETREARTAAGGR